MKKFLLTFLAFTAGFLPLAAQDWAPFKMGRTPYFQAGDSIYSLRITDAYVQGNDSVFEFNPRVLSAGNFSVINGCFSNSLILEAKPVQDNLFGYQMLKSAIGDYSFAFTSGDTFYLKPYAAVNQTWQFSNSQQLPVTATLQTRTAGLVQGIADSIVTIQLSTGGQIRLSKQFGLLSARSFYSYLSNTSLSQSLNLARLPEAGIGLPVNHPYRVFDYQPGDKFLRYGYSTNNSGGTCSENWTTSEILSRTESPTLDSIWYEVRVQTLRKEYATPNAPPGFFCFASSLVELSPFDTVVITIRLNDWPHIYDLCHEYAPLPTETYSAFFNTGKYISNYHNRISTKFNDLPYDSCASVYYNVVDGSYADRVFTEGLGLTRSSYLSSWGSESVTYLSAYIKGTETYGNWQPLVLGADELEVNPIQVYPNPFTNELSIKLPEDKSAEITIYNLQGQKIRVLKANGNANIQLPEIAAGLYVLHVLQDDKSYIAKVRKQ